MLGTFSGIRLFNLLRAGLDLLACNDINDINFTRGDEEFDTPYRNNWYITNPADHFNHKSKSFKGNKRKGM
jgi:hypothetical protein